MIKAILAFMSATVCAFWIHVFLYMHGVIPLEPKNRDHFAAHLEWWFLGILALTWVQVAVTTYAFLRINKRIGVLGAAIWVAQVATIGWMVAAASSL